eukprot:614080-Rhodomonas_salina.2
MKSRAPPQRAHAPVLDNFPLPLAIPVEVRRRARAAVILVRICARAAPAPARHAMHANLVLPLVTKRRCVVRSNLGVKRCGFRGAVNESILFSCVAHLRALPLHDEEQGESEDQGAKGQLPPARGGVDRARYGHLSLLPDLLAVEQIAAVAAAAELHGP